MLYSPSLFPGGGASLRQEALRGKKGEVLPPASPQGRASRDAGSSRGRCRLIVIDDSQRAAMAARAGGRGQVGGGTKGGVDPGGVSGRGTEGGF